MMGMRPRQNWQLLLSLTKRLAWRQYLVRNPVALPVPPPIQMSPERRARPLPERPLSSNASEPAAMKCPTHKIRNPKFQVPNSKRGATEEIRNDIRDQSVFHPWLIDLDSEFEIWNLDFDFWSFACPRPHPPPCR